MDSLIIGEMMSYSSFAYWYDGLNQAADYDRLFDRTLSAFHRYGIGEGILADLGCGTGEMALRFAAAGYTVLAVDSSADMLAVCQDKLAGAAPCDVLLLQQDLACLDLYGTIRGAYASFDTLNHLPPDVLEQALARVSLFMESGGLFVFDANTPYKHSDVLANNEFCIEDENRTGITCVWKNNYCAAQTPPSTRIHLRFIENGEEVHTESFLEYAYTLPFWEEALVRHGFFVQEVCDGETFAPLSSDSQRFFFTALKK